MLRPTKVRNEYVLLSRSRNAKILLYSLPETGKKVVEAGRQAGECVGCGCFLSQSYPTFPYASLQGKIAGGKLLHNMIYINTTTRILLLPVFYWDPGN